MPGSHPGLTTGAVAVNESSRLLGAGALYRQDIGNWASQHCSAGGLIDTTINPNLIPPATPGGPQPPQPTFNTSPLLAQGLTFGVRYGF